MPKKLTIGLNMIVKNEEKVIKKALDSVAPLVDYYLIVDTGSTDNTKKIIEETMKGHDIPGKVIDHKWKNFADARNRALKEIEGHTDWVFWLDSDETLEIGEKFNKEQLFKELKGFESADSEVIYGLSKYTRCQWLINDGTLKWTGAVHEIPSVTREGGMVSNITTHVSTSGASWGDGSKETVKKKYEEHARLLLDYVKEDDNPRWVFYLAQSYRDADMLEEAIVWYRKRVELEGYWEERYYSQLMVGVLLARLNASKDERLVELQKCAMLDPYRADHFLEMMIIYQSQKNWPMAYAVGNYAIEHCSANPFPKSRLFLNPAVWELGLVDIHSITVSYLGKIYELKRMVKFLEERIDSYPDRERIERNLNHFNKQLEAIKV